MASLFLGSALPKTAKRWLQQGHRWLGIFGALWLAIWFASGMVMHFVPFPALTLQERLNFSLPLQAGSVQLSLKDALQQAGLSAQQVQGPVTLWQRGEQAVYQFRLAHASSTSSDLKVLNASTGEPVKPIATESELKTLLAPYFSAATLATSQAQLIELDQWTVASSLNQDRPLWRLQQADGQWWYFSAQSGALVRDVSRSERWWNYAGAVLHWVYFTPFRAEAGLWRESLWILSLLVLLAAVSGVWLGLLRMRKGKNQALSPYRGTQRWHHLLGLGCAGFVLTYLLSGWLSLDGGRVFRQVAPLDSRTALQGGEFQPELFAKPFGPKPFGTTTATDFAVKEIQLLQLAQQPYQRLLGLSDQTNLPDQLLLTGNVQRNSFVPSRFFDQATLALASKSLAEHFGCEPLGQIAATSAYRVAGLLPELPVYQLQCKLDNTVLQFDSASGLLTSNTNTPQRGYRWFYQALHTLDFPLLLAYPTIRTGLTLLLGVIGLLFSLTAVLLAFKRLKPVAKRTSVKVPASGQQWQI